ncbi:MAG TPA: DUF3151 domain-containing protein, partial [Acidimicrobiaceae bacterium]|nr:DUF3151 domain-containing protein [Acidimicrobiaceae bacterium]
AYDAQAVTQLLEALNSPAEHQRAFVADVAAKWPRFLDAWVALGQLSQDTVEAYAYFRVGYHRGLDTLRASGWRGSGYVRWDKPSNHGFLRALLGLARCAHEIGEVDEAERCAQFLAQLDPSGIPENE